MRNPGKALVMAGRGRAGSPLRAGATLYARGGVQRTACPTRRDRPVTNPESFSLDTALRGGHIPEECKFAGLALRGSNSIRETRR